MLQLAKQIDDATECVRSLWRKQPSVGIVLGSGLGHFVENIDIEATIPYEQIPHFPLATAVGHVGALICGAVEGLPVVAMQGRFHLYEGYSPQQVTLPIRVMGRLGIELLILSNAAGGLNPQYRQGDVMLIDDQINLMFRNPLIGINDDDLGNRFPDLSRPYDGVWLNRAEQTARQHDVHVQRGVYAGLSGPTYETRAEYRMLRKLGADAVGMSTVPETIVAAHMGLSVLAMSIITNVCQPDSLGATDAAAVVATASLAQPRLQKIVLDVLRQVDALRQANDHP